MRVLIAPVGEQPTPNLIPLFAAAPEARAECVQFLRSDDARIQKVAEHLGEAIARDPVLTGVTVANPRPMDAWNLSKAREDCEGAIRKYKDDGHDVVVNLTGGTKIMSLAAYQAAGQCEVPMLYVNTKDQELIHFDARGNPVEPTSFTAPISIETQLCAAGREFKLSKPPTRPEDISPGWAEFARQVVYHYQIAYTNLIRKIISNPDGAKLHPVSFTPDKKGKDIAQKAHDLNLWRWDEASGTITVTNKTAYQFLHGGWVEVFALTTLANDDRFDEVLGNVKVEDVEGEMDVLVSCNGRLGIMECKTKGNQDEPGLTFTAAKIRLHQVIFGGPYAEAMYALPAKIDATQRKIFEQYNLPEPIWGASLKRLADIVANMLGC